MRLEGYRGTVKDCTVSFECIPPVKTVRNNNFKVRYFQTIFRGLLLCLCVIYSINCYAQEGLQPRLQVEAIRIIGNKTFSDDELKKLMDTKENGFLDILKKADYYDENTFSADVKRIAQFYQSEGFYDAVVRKGDIVYTDSDSVILTVEIDEGKPIIISSLHLIVNNEEKSSWHDEFMDLIPLEKGKRFRIDDFEQSEANIIRYLADLGYPKALVQRKAKIFRKNRQAEVFISVDTGHLCTFGAISFNGLRKVEKNEVKRNLMFKPGERFSASKIARSQKQLYDTQLFTYVDINVEGLDGEETSLPVVVTLSEAKPYTIKSGFGYGTEEQLRGKLEFEARRFLGDARLLRGVMKGSFIEQRAEAQFLQPHLLNTPHRIEWNAGWGREDQESYDVSTFYSNPRLYMIVNPDWQWYTGHNLEFNKLESIDIILDLDDLSERQKDNYFISSAVLGFIGRHVDDILDPGRGYQIFSRTEWASSYTGSDVAFIKTDWEARLYVPVSSLIFGFRARWGTIVNLEDDKKIPIFKRFFAGGSSSIRGYPYQKLGPLDLEGNPLGGKSVLEMNFDTRFPISALGRSFQGVLFFDAGQVYSEQLSLSPSELRYTTGCGVRYKTPIGPLRFDIGYQLNPPDQDFFGPVQVYFSIGQAF